MSAMAVNPRAAKYCCRGCFPEYGKSSMGTKKTKFKRQLKRRDRQNWKKEL